MSTWENFHTGTLYLGVINGPTEGIVLGCTLILISGIYGTEIWRSSVPQVFGDKIASFFPSDWLLLDVLVLFMTIALFTTQLPIAFRSVYKACKRKKRNFTMAIFQWVPYLLLLAMFYWWLVAPGSTVFHSHFLLFSLTFGVIFGNMATKVILAHLTHMPFPMFNVMYLPLLLGGALANAPTMLKMYVLYAFCNSMSHTTSTY
jgi:ethanolaminephosphotransferase